MRQKRIPEGCLHTTRIEANITYRCNAICRDCNKAVGLARFEGMDMTAAQMRRAVKQLNDQKIHVARFTLCGGEPCLNKELQQILFEIAELNSFGHCRILTNGMPVSKPIRDRINLPSRKFFWIDNPLDDPNDPLSGKNNRKARPNGRIHMPFWVSPADVGKPASYEHCRVQGWCGIGLDANGWSACGKMAMFSKLLGIEGAVKADCDIIKHARAGVEDACKHCQYGLADSAIGEKEIFNRANAGEIPRISSTFEKAFACHKEHGDLVQLELMA